jgi:hypothetical protein
MMMDIYAKIIERIIKAQEAIIGPIAVEQAGRVSGLKLDWDNHEVHIEGDKTDVVNNLIGVYQELFGQISKEVSKEAAAPLLGQLKANELPESLK